MTHRSHAEPTCYDQVIACQMATDNVRGGGDFGRLNELEGVSPLRFAVFIDWYRTLVQNGFHWRLEALDL